ncbi:MAG: hypothetical protein GY810_28340 [Aureispira sp.]|nr:hypothetical protein [Aureispira sp.]
MMSLTASEYFNIGYISTVNGIYYEEVQVHHFANGFRDKIAVAGKVADALMDRLNNQRQTTANNIGYVNHLYERLGLGKIGIPQDLSEYADWQSTNFNKTKKLLPQTGLNTYLLACGNYIGTLEKCCTILLSTLYLSVGSNRAITAPDGIVEKSIDALKKYEKQLTLVIQLLKSEDGFDFMADLGQKINDQVYTVISAGMVIGGPLGEGKDPNELFNLANQATGNLTQMAVGLLQELEKRYSKT